MTLNRWCHDAEEFNDFFWNIGNLTTQHLPIPDDVLWLGGNSIYDFKFRAIDESIVLKLLKGLGTNSSLDILNIDCKLLKLAAECIASTLTHSFNISLQCVIAPSYWKYSRVTPIYKGAGDVKDCSNFRHISVIGHIAKMLEKEVQCQACWLRMVTLRFSLHV